MLITLHSTLDTESYQVVICKKHLLHVVNPAIATVIGCSIKSDSIMEYIDTSSHKQVIKGENFMIQYNGNDHDYHFEFRGSYITLFRHGIICSKQSNLEQIILILSHFKCTAC